MLCVFGCVQDIRHMVFIFAGCSRSCSCTNLNLNAHLTNCIPSILVDSCLSLNALAALAANALLIKFNSFILFDMFYLT